LEVDSRYVAFSLRANHAVLTMESGEQHRSQRRLPAQRECLTTNTLGSTQAPAFAFEPRSAKSPVYSNTFRVPSPTDSDEEETQGPQQEASDPQLPVQLNLHTSQHPLDFQFTGNSSTDLSNLGDSSSLFSIISPSTTPALAQRTSAQPFHFGESRSITSNTIAFESPQAHKMVVEREPPKATPQKPSQPAFHNVQQPEFGKPSPLQNRLQPNNVFNMPRPHQSRPEHHRIAAPPGTSHLQQMKDLAHKFVDPLRPHQQPIQPRPSQSDADVVDIPRPTDAPSLNAYPRPPQAYSSLNPPTSGFQHVNAYNYQHPVIDFTKPPPSKQTAYQDPALLDDRFGAADPYLYVDAGKATENIKALLEGAFEDEEDKPRTRGRKQKVEASVAGLTDKLQGLGVKSEENKEDIEDKDEEGEEDEEDDGTVEGLKVKLLPHQVDGVEWMKDKEIGTKRKNGVLPKGGILADDMGLGKTIQSIALILTNPRPSSSNTTSVTDKRALTPLVGMNTLVVAPLALIKQWEAEIKNRVLDSHKLRVCVHHGPQRTKRFEDLKKYDVVITTYQILVSEHGSSPERENGPQAGCFGIHWYRVVLDEAHTIKNRNAKATQACCALRSEYRWCLTGTPMQNNLDELQSLIKFLRIKPYNDLPTWKDQITRPMSQGRGGIAIKRLQFFLKAFMKRRTKDVLKEEGALNPGGKPSKDGQNNGFKITARRIESIEAHFSPEERTFYDRLEQRTDRSLEQMMGGEKMNYASALVLLLRLRQACNHPQLVGGSMAKDRDALTTGQSAGSQSPRKSKVADNELDEMADLLGGLSVQTKQCDVCQIELSKSEVCGGSIRCTECEEDLVSQKVGKGKTKERRHKKNHSSAKAKLEASKPRARKNRNVVLDDSDEEDADAEWVAPEHERHAPDLGKAGGTDDENAEGGGESLLSDDTDTDEDSSVKIVEPKRPKVISLDTSDEAAEDDDSVSEEDDDNEEVSPSDSEHSLASITTSAKIQYLLKILHRECSSHKFIIFSQFTSMLDLIEPFLKQDGLIFTRYDGSMRNDHREASLERLRNNSKIRILLCSLKCGSLGLNLTAASRVVILEPFWNPFVEEQAIDRVHRLNQTLDVTVYKLTVANTVEARILELQEKKRALAAAAIGGDGKAAGKLTMKDILNLFRRDAEHDTRHDVDSSLGTKTRVLTNGTSTGSAPAAYSDRSGQSSMRVTPPAMKKPGGARKEDAVYGRRW